MAKITTSELAWAALEGAFPMDDNGNLAFYVPLERCLFPLEGPRISHSLAKFLRNNPYRVSFDTAFVEVMRGCLRPTNNWISEEIIELYTEAHREGWAHSVEIWEDRELVGGSYGIAIGGCFCAESMFHRRTNTSKLALVELISKCRALGFTLFDAQMHNSHLESLGAYTIPQGEYLKLLRDAQKIHTAWSLQTK